MSASNFNTFLVYGDINMECAYHNIGNTDSKIYSLATPVDGLITITSSKVESESTVNCVFKFDGCKVVIEQSFSGGSASSVTGGFSDVRILCRGRRD